MAVAGATDLTKSVFLLNTIGEMSVEVVSREGFLEATQALEATTRYEMLSNLPRGIEGASAGRESEPGDVNPASEDTNTEELW
jgi:hypothetical protein